MIRFDIAGYIIFAFITSITPGPNNYLLFSYGKNHGFKDAGKLMFGIFIGFLLLLYISGYGVAELITKNPTIELILKIASSIWMFYLAMVFRKPNFNFLIDLGSKAGFYQGFFMQFVNPKSWIMAISGASAFLPHLNNIHLSVFVFAIIFGLIGVPCMILWVFFGEVISNLLKSERANRILGFGLFVLMNISILMIWV